jgi:hypothetical protein
MEWIAGQKVHYTYIPKVYFEEKKEYYGEIVHITNEGIVICWNSFSGPETYSRNSYIVRHLHLISELDKNNPNRKFAENKNKHAIL